LKPFASAAFVGHERERRRFGQRLNHHRFEGCLIEGQHLAGEIRELAQLQVECRFAGLNHEIGEKEAQPPAFRSGGLGRHGPWFAGF
jgi:hypothetical protein